MAEPNLFHEQCCGLCEYWRPTTAYITTGRVCKKEVAGLEGSKRMYSDGTDCRHFSEKG